MSSIQVEMNFSDLIETIAKSTKCDIAKVQKVFEEYFEQAKFKPKHSLKEEEAPKTTTTKKIVEEKLKNKKPENDKPEKGEKPKASPAKNEKSKVSLKEKVEKAVEEGKVFNVDTGRVMAYDAKKGPTKQQKEKYDFTYASQGVVGKEKLKEAIKELNLVKGSSEVKKDEKTSTKPNFKLNKNKNVCDEKTKLCADPVLFKKEKKTVVIGSENDEGDCVPLTPKNIKLCKELKLEYREEDQDGVDESTIAALNDEEEVDDDEEDVKPKKDAKKKDKKKEKQEMTDDDDVVDKALDDLSDDE